MRFFASASHDLRQPLHAIGLFGAVLEKELKGWAGGLLASLEKRPFHRRVPRAGDSRGEFDRRLYSLLTLERWYRHVLSVPRSKRMAVAERLRFRARTTQRPAPGAGAVARRRSSLAANPQA